MSKEDLNSILVRKRDEKETIFDFIIGMTGNNSNLLRCLEEKYIEIMI